MSQVGGSATINGVLYQILGTLHHASQIAIRSKCSDAEWTEAQLRIEPFGGGGDVQLLGSDIRIVEQWKAKSDGGSWSVKAVVQEVLPDLFLAIDGDRLAEPVEYRFVTEGHEGRFKATNELLSKLSSSSPPSDPLAALDDSTPKSFFANEQHTERAFFIQILKEVRKRERVRKEPCPLSIRKVWHLMARFRFAQPLPFDELKAAVNSTLAELVETRDEVESKRLQVCAALMEMARKGEVVLTPSEFLVRVGLRARPFGDELGWKVLKRVAAEDLERKLRSLRYVVAQDVRPVFQNPTTDKPVALGGESGTGKSWVLARLASESHATNSVPVFVEATGDAEKTLQRVADVLWRTGLDHDQQLPLDSVTKRMRERLPARSEPFASVFIDNVQTVAEARHLLQQPWAIWKVAVAIAMPTPTAAAIAKTFGDAVASISVGDFSALELREFLKRRQREWATVPPDIRETLRRPLFAALYCDVAVDANWHPKNEYQLCSRYWERLGISDYPHDITVVKRLAKTLLDDAAPYPWPGQTLLDHGVDHETRNRLEAVGWLRRLDGDKAAVWHDRLLNWALAQTIAEELQIAAANREELLVFVSKQWDPRRGWGNRRLGYLPADILWILANASSGSASVIIVDLLKHLEGSHPMSFNAQSLYKEILPTIGEAILQPILSRMELAVTADSKPLPAYVATPFVELASGHVTKLSTAMLRSERREVKQVALHVLKKVPSNDVMNELWAMHCDNIVALDQKEDGLRFRDYELSLEALRSCVALEPEWIAERLQVVTCADRTVAELAVLISSLPEAAGRSLWSRLKPRLFEVVPPSGRRSLVGCIARFGDTSETNNLVAWLSDSGWTAMYAYNALCMVSPDTALAHLRSVGLESAWLTYSHWMQELFSRRPNETRAAFLNWMKEVPERVPDLARLLRVVPHHIDSQILDGMLDAMDRELQKDPAVLAKEAGPLMTLLECLAAAWSSAALNGFSERSGTELDRRLGGLLSTWLANQVPSIDFLLDAAIDVLLKFGGVGFTEAINALLKHSNPWSYHKGLTWASVRPDDETKVLLRRIARSEQQEVTAKSQPERIPYQQSRALVALAALGDDEILGELISKWGDSIVEDDLVDVCTGLEPMKDADIAPALTQLTKPAVAARSLVLIGLSRRKDLVPQVKSFVMAGQPLNTIAAALRALESLDHRDPELVPRLIEFMEIKELRSPAVRHLIHLDTPESCAALESALVQSGKMELPNCHLRVGAFLLSKPTHKQRVLNYLWGKVRERWSPWERLGAFGEESFAVFAELNTREVEDFLWEQAFPKSTGMHFVGRTETAIRGLARIDPEEAFHAAELLLASAGKDRELLPELFMEIDAARAIPILCDNAVREKSPMALWRTGKVLRASGQADIVQSLLHKMLNSDDAEVQRAGAALVGWQGVDFLSSELERLASLSFDTKTREAARESLSIQRIEKMVKELVQELGRTTGAAAWCRAEGICELLNPVLLDSSFDAYGIRIAARQLPAILCQHINDRLRNSRETQKRKAEDLERDAKRKND